MRKRQIHVAQSTSSPGEDPWLDVQRLATVEFTSEEAAHPVEAALLPTSSDNPGWWAAEPGPQILRLIFDSSQSLRRIRLCFVETGTPRTQEFVLRWSADGGLSFQELVRQQWNFSPTGATQEVEDYRVQLDGVNVLELVITPDVTGGEARASLAQWRLA